HLIYQSMRVTRRTVLKGLAATGMTVVGAGGAYGFAYGRHDLVVTREAVPVAGFPRDLAGLRVGFITDIHRSYWVSHDDVARAVARLMDERPDIIVLGGDYVTYGGGANREYVRPAAEALDPLEAPHGVYAILGNHDDDHDMPAALSARGIQVLRDARTRVTIKGEALELV